MCDGEKCQDNTRANGNDESYAIKSHAKTSPTTHGKIDCKWTQQRNEAEK
jgi:hypothetical protein